MNINANMMSFTDYSQLQESSGTQGQISQEKEYDFQSLLNNKLSNRDFKNLYSGTADTNNATDAESMQFVNIEDLNLAEKEITDLLLSTEALIEQLNENESGNIYSEVLSRLLKLIKKMTNGSEVDYRAVMLVLADVLASSESVKYNLDFASKKSNNKSDTSTENINNIGDIYGSGNVGNTRNTGNALKFQTTDGQINAQTESLIGNELFKGNNLSEGNTGNNNVDSSESSIYSGEKINSEITTTAENDLINSLFGIENIANTHQSIENQTSQISEELQITQSIIEEPTVQEFNRNTNNAKNRRITFERNTFLRYNPQQTSTNDFQNFQVTNETEILNLQNIQNKQYHKLNHFYSGLRQNDVNIMYNAEKNNYNGEAEAIKKLFSGLQIQLETGKNISSAEQLDKAAQELFDKLLLTAQERLGLQSEEKIFNIENGKAIHDTEFLGLDYIKGLKLTSIKDSTNHSNVKNVPDELSQLLSAFKSEKGIETAAEKNYSGVLEQKSDSGLAEKNILNPETIITIPNIVRAQNASIYEQLPLEQPISPEKQVSDIILAKINTLKSGATKLEVTLTPESLGKVTIKLVAESGRVSVEVIAEKLETQMLLQNRAEQLGQNLKQNGVELEKYVVYQEQGQETYYNQDGGRKQKQQQEEQNKSYKETEDESSLSFSELITAV